MKKKTTIVAILCAAAVAFALTACGGSKPAETQAAAPAETEAAAPAETQAAPAETQAAAPEETQAAPAETEAAAAESADLSAPGIVIEFGDAAAIEELAKKAQNFEVEEGAVAQISGIFNSGISTPSIQEQKDDSSAVGISMYVDGDWEAPADGTELEVVGSFVKGQYFMEFHVTPDNITIK